jgi:hypothetical protein
MEEINRQDSEVEGKRTKDTIAVDEKADDDKNEINESKTEKELDFLEEKEALLV